jgi:ABC-type dipeptide/oligopeptide/nickel transport system permease component
MSTYVVRRILLLPLTVLLLSMFVFTMIRLVPVTVIDQRLNSATPQT